MASQTNLQKYFGKCTLTGTRQVQTKISSFLKPTKEKEIIMRLFTLEVSVFVFVYGKINLRHKFSIHNHQWKLSYILLLYFLLGTSLSSPSPTKKRVGRPIKLYTSDQVRDMITKYHYFQEMVDFSKNVSPSCLRFTASHPCLRPLGRLPKLGDALPQKRKKYA